MLSSSRSNVTPREAANKEFASYCAIDFKVPKVYRYFKMSGVGYLVMEFINGVPLDTVALHQRPDLVQRLAAAIHSLNTVVLSDSLGPRNRGIFQGYLFPEDGAGQEILSSNDLNTWLNERARLDKDEVGFDFRQSDCILWHLDLARRNIVLLPDESFGLFA